MSIKIQNKTALITGANRGIGKSIVESFLENGVKKVYLAVRKLDSVKNLVLKYGDKVEAVKVDLTDIDSIKKLATQAQDVEILVNNAGVLIPADPLSQGAEAALTQELNVNTFGLLRIAQAFKPILEKNKGSAFIQLNSIASIKNFTDFTTYSASKAASYSITQGLKESFAPIGIHVLSVHPGPIATDMAIVAGIEEGSEPASVVSLGIIKALEKGVFHLFPDSLAKDFESAYESYSTNVIEAVA